MAKNKYIIIDRRKNAKGKSDSIRHRFLQRHNKSIREAVKQAITTRSIKESVTEGAIVKVKEYDTREWTFYHDHTTGVWKGVNPGNDRFQVGDLVLKPPQQGGSGNGGSPDGEGEDEFEFGITKDELEQYFFDELALPDMVKQSIANVEEWKTQRAGFSTIGLPCNLDLVRSMKNSIGRELSLDDDTDEQVFQLQQQMEKLLRVFSKTPEQQRQIVELKKRIDELLANADDSISMDKMDLRYRSHTKVPVPNTRAVMFCILDVSASMGEHEKMLAKYFFLLLFLFLSREYDKVDIRFIRHHTIAKEVDEEEFFHSRETGGTIVSGALEMMKEIIDKDYNDGTWNIYGAQASDGDNWDDDQRLHDVMVNSIMPIVQYFAYIEVLNPNDQWREAGNTSVWNTYSPIRDVYGNLDLASIKQTKDIFPVFAELFNKNRKRRKV